MWRSVQKTIGFVGFCCGGPLEALLKPASRCGDAESKASALHDSVVFMARAKKVEKFMNSKRFAAGKDGQGLQGLARDLRARCREVVSRQGERIPK